MCGGGSGGQLKPITTSTTTADPRAQAMYQQAFGTAQQAAQTPFQRYSTDPRAFVAQLTPTQQQAISNIAQSQGVYQPYYGAAAGLAGGAGTTSTADIVGQYMSPYMSQVVDPVRAALQQQQGMQLSQQQAEAIKGGAFGGERAGLQRAALRGQQQLGMGQALSPLYQTGYGQALGAAQGDLARQLQAGQVMGGLGTGAQQAAMQGAQGLLGAGTLQQQTQQAGLQALYNQFLMERGYPFQTSQFLTSAAAGLGPLYGGTTVEQQATNPFGQFLSDPRAKTGVDREEPDVVGKLNDGQNVYAYRYANGGPAQIGLMADEVAQRYPDAVGQRPDGLMTVDYGRATEVPAAMSHGLGAARMGGAVTDGGDYARGGYAIGGHLSYVDPNDPGASDRRRMDALLASHKGGADTFVPTKMDIPTGAVQASQGLQPARTSGRQQQVSPGISGLLKKGAEMGESASSLSKTYDFFKNKLSGPSSDTAIRIVGGAGGYPVPTLAQGGVPTSLDIPTEAIHASRGLEPARISGSGREEEDDGILGALGKVADIGSKAATIGSLAMKAAPFVMSLSDPRAKTGVRHGYADRGAVPTEDDVFERGLLGAESAHRQFDKYGRPLTSSAGAVGISQVLPSTGPEAAKLANLPFDLHRLKYDEDYNKALGKAYFDEQRRRFGSDELAAAAYNAGPGRVQQALRQAEATGRDVMSFLPAETRAYVPKVMGRGDADAAEKGIAAVRSQIPMGDPRRSFMAKDLESQAGAPPPAGVKPPGEEPGFMDKYMKEEYVVPGLIGLAGAVEGALSAPTTSLGAALARGAATGVGAGAKAYEDIQTALPARAKTRAEAAERQAQAGATGALGTKTTVEAAKTSLVMGPNGLPIGAVVSDPKTGAYRYMDFGELYRNRESVNLLPQEAALVEQAAKSQGLAGAAGVLPAVEQATKTAKEITQKQPTKEAVVSPAPGELAPAEGLKPIPKMFSVGPEDRKKITEQINSLTGTDISGQEKFFRDQEGISAGAATQKPLAAELAAAFSKLPATGPLAPGAAQPKVASVAEWVNSLANVAGFKGPVNQADLSTLDQINKLTAQLKAAATAANDQRALGALDEFEKMFPTGKATRGGIAKNLSAILMMNQKELDKIHYFNDWKKTASGINPTLAAASGAMANTTFNEKYNAQYDKESKQIEKMLMTDVPGVKNPETNRPMNWFAYLSEHGGELSPAEKKLVESKFGDGILRYFTSVQR